MGEMMKRQSFDNISQEVKLKLSEWANEKGLTVNELLTSIINDNEKRFARFGEYYEKQRMV